MTIACTRCGATEDGNIISAPIAFAFKHNLGCGHGVGPLAVLPSGFKKKSKVEKDPDVVISDESEFSTTKFKIAEGKSEEHFVTELPEPKEDIKVEEKPKKSVKEKIKVFGKREKSDDQ